MSQPTKIEQSVFNHVFTVGNNPNPNCTIVFAMTVMQGSFFIFPITWTEFTMQLWVNGSIEGPLCYWEGPGNQITSITTQLEELFPSFVQKLLRIVKETNFPRVNSNRQIQMNYPRHGSRVRVTHEIPEGLAMQTVCTDKKLAESIPSFVPPQKAG